MDLLRKATDISGLVRTRSCASKNQNFKRVTDMQYHAASRSPLPQLYAKRAERHRKGAVDYWTIPVLNTATDERAAGRDIYAQITYCFKKSRTSASIVHYGRWWTPAQDTATIEPSATQHLVLLGHQRESSTQKGLLFACDKGQSGFGSDHYDRKYLSLEFDDAALEVGVHLSGNHVEKLFVYDVTLSSDGTVNISEAQRNNADFEGHSTI